MSEELEKQAQEILRGSESNIDSGTSDALYKARINAMNAGNTETATPWYFKPRIALPFAGAACCLTIATAISLQSTGQATDIEAMPEISMNSEELMISEEIDLYEDLEFYEWLADEENTI